MNLYRLVTYILIIKNVGLTLALLYLAYGSFQSKTVASMILVFLSMIPLVELWMMAEDSKS